MIKLEIKILRDNKKKTNFYLLFECYVTISENKIMFVSKIPKPCFLYRCCILCYNLSKNINLYNIKR